MSSAWSSAAATSSAASPAQPKGFDRATGDYMGMLATVMNALAVQNALEKIGVDTRVQSAIPDGERVRALSSAAAPCGTWRRAGSSSSPRAPAIPISPPTPAAALRAAEMGCDALFKGTSVDGVYDADPKKVASANRYDSLELQPRAGRRPEGHGRQRSCACAATTIFRSSCSTSASPATWPKCWPDAGRRRSSRTRSERMPAYDKNDTRAPHARRARSVEARPGRPAHRPRLDRLARSDPGRGLWRQHADQPGRDRVRAGAAHCCRCRCGTESNVGPVEKAIRYAGPRDQPDRRRPDHPPADPRPDRGAPQGTGQACRSICRKGAHRRPQRPPRRHGCAQDRREEARDQRRRAQAARAPRSRS